MLWTSANRASGWRIGLGILIALIALYTLVVAVFAVTNIFVQAVAGTATLQLTGGPANQTGFGEFTSVGTNGMQIIGRADTVSVFIPGLSGGSLALKYFGDLLGVIAQFALATCAVALGRGLLRGQPFSRAATRGALAAAVALLVVGVLAQVVAWLARVAILNEAGSYDFSRTAFTFDPLLVTVGLALVLVVGAFRAGERLQRDTEGLV
jgi:hypothetical protein